MLSRPLLDRVAFLGISWYAVLIVGAMVIGYFLASNEARRLRLPQDTVIDFMLYAVPLGIICARLYYVVFREVNINLIIHLAGQNFADFVQGFSRNNDFSVRIRIFQLNSADRNTVSVQRYDAKCVIFDFKKLTGHQFVVLIGCNGENGLTDQFF